MNHTLFPSAKERMCEDREDKSSATLTALPSFGQPPKLLGSPYTASPQHFSQAEADEDALYKDFEFSSLICDSENQPPITADEIFSDGRIRPIYPAALADASAPHSEKRKRRQLIQLLVEEPDWSTSESSSSYADDLEGIPPETFCLWPPDHSQNLVHRCCRCSTVLGFRIRDLVLGRSNSNGKKIFRLAAKEKRTEKKADAVRGEIKGKGYEKRQKDMDLITAFQLNYGHSNGRAPREESRKSFLPYKPEIGVFFHGAG